MLPMPPTPEHTHSTPSSVNAMPEVVDQVHAAALAAGGTCDGEPGKRLPTFYGAYFRDLDGNKFCAFKMG